MANFPFSCMVLQRMQGRREKGEIRQWEVVQVYLSFLEFLGYFIALRLGIVSRQRRRRL